MSPPRKNVFTDAKASYIMRSTEYLKLKTVGKPDKGVKAVSELLLMDVSIYWTICGSGDE